MNSMPGVARKPSDWRLITRLLRYLFPYKWTMAASLLLMVANVPFAAAAPLLTKAAIDLFILPDPSHPPSGYVLWVRQGAELAGLGGSRHQGLAFVAILFLLTVIIQSVIHYQKVLLTEAVSQNAIHDFRREVFCHLQRVPIQFYDRTAVGQMMTRVTTDVDSLYELFNSGFGTIFGHVAMVAYSVVWMFRMSWFLALVSCSALLLLVIFATWFRITSRPVFRHLRQQIGLVNAFLQEHLVGVQVVQLFNRENREKTRFESLIGAHLKAATAVTLRNAFFYPATGTVLSIGSALILWFGGGHVIARWMSLGTLVAFLQFTQSFYDPVSEISARYPMLQGALASCENIFALLDEPLAPAPLIKTVRHGAMQGRIEFRNVWFAYQGEDWALKDVSFSIAPGEKVALVGRTGSGKTTITSLLLRFYEIQRGEILLDGVDVREINPVELRSSFAIVPQENALFCGDFLWNIGLGDASISESKVRAAAQEVCLDDFIMNFENGYHTGLHKGGAGLSVGQKQLVGLARALVFDRPVLILDEATSSIDAQTEARIRRAIQRVMSGRTALVIAHRLSTIQSVDKILVMQKGEVRESGDHKSLCARRGLYWKLYQLQFHQDLRAAAIGIAADD